MAKFQVELEHTDWQVILMVLASGPYRDVAPVIGRVSEQLNGQQPKNGAGTTEQPQDNG